MHWPSYDKATWGILLGIVAILLAFPLSLIANLVTPKIRNWWAERSVATIKERIASLESEVTKIGARSLFPWDHVLLLKFGQWLGVSAVSMFVCLLGFATCFVPLLPILLGILAMIMIGLGIIFGAFAGYLLIHDLGRFLDKRSPLHKIDVELSIKELSAKLRSLQNS